MKTYTKLFIAAVILFFLPTGGLTQLIALICFVVGIISLTNEKTESRSNGTAPRPDAGQQTYTYTYSTGKPKYTDEARRACEDVTPKRKRDEKPPWEE